MNKSITYFLFFLLSLFTTTHILMGENCFSDEDGNIYVTTWKDNGNNNNPIEGSLRAAIICANSLNGPNQIYFDTVLASNVEPIRLSHTLPPLTDDYTTIDASSVGLPYITLDGSLISGGASGLTIQGDGCKIYGFYIHNFSRYGITIQHSNNSQIGSIQHGNIISDNNYHGINIEQVQNLIIEGNKIGTNPEGMMAVPNKYAGIDIIQSTNIEIINNLISGNLYYGINIGEGHIFGNEPQVCESITIRNNKIGTDITGKSIVPNHYDGININGGIQIDITENVISGNLYNGIGIGMETPFFGEVEETSQVTIAKNKIGTDITGTTPLDNHYSGISIEGGVRKTTIIKNVIAANKYYGISVGRHYEFLPDDIENPPAKSTHIEENTIGTDPTGGIEMRNKYGGIGLRNAMGTTINDNTIAYHSTGIGVIGNSEDYQIQFNSIFCNNKGININTTLSATEQPIILQSTLHSIAGKSLPEANIELFVNDDTACEGKPCQGKYYLGNCLADDNGNWTLISSDFQHLLQTGDKIVATATVFNTSEFTDCLEVEGETINCHHNDSLQLVQFYQIMDGDNWTNNTGWLEVPLSEWHGITLSEDGCHVQEIILTNNQLSGNIADLKDLQLPLLTKLILNKNEIGGIFPDFSALPNLYAIHVSDNILHGAIPDFSHIPNLRNFYAQRNRLSGSIPDFSNLPNLKLLYIGSNSISGTIPDFSNTPRLRRLHSTFNELEGQIPNFQNTPELEVLWLGGNKLEGKVPEFSQVPNLQRLRLFDNKLNGDLPSFSHQSELFELMIQGNRFIFGNFMPAWETMTEIQTNCDTDLCLQYAPQQMIPIQIEEGYLSVEVGGNLADNQYTWYKNGEVLPNMPISGDSILTITESGSYCAAVTNALITQPDVEARNLVLNSECTIGIIVDIDPVEEKSLSLQVLPNPSHTFVEVQLPTPLHSPILSYQIIGLDGRIWEKQTFPSNLSPQQPLRIDWSATIPDGTYLLYFQLEDGSYLHSEKLVKTQ